MWRPVALSALLALLFVSSRSGQAPVETNTNDLTKTDFGASAPAESGEPASVEFDLAKSSAHPMTTPADEASDKAQESVDADAPLTVASLADVIPLPVPKADGSESGTRVVVAQGEQKTALTTDEQALQLLPPGPDFAAKVQQELSRLGCYRGRVDNIWGPMSRNAVARFNRVAKAKLPLKQPTRALLSSARNAPDNYCNGGGSGSRVASLDPGAGLEALKDRPSYLPPWMRGEPMPEHEPQEEQAESGPDATPQAAPQRNTTTSNRPTRTQRTQARERRAQRREVRRRQVRRQVRRAQRSPSFTQNIPGWPGSGAGR